MKNKIREFIEDMGGAQEVIGGTVAWMSILAIGFMMSVCLG